jgi:23S rRNA (uracil1939-C5)-methyltransferase
MELTIEKLTYGPDAIGHLGNVVVFVDGVIPGDIVDVKIIKKQKNYQRGQVLKVIKRSEKYVKAPCPVFSVCGGCQWQNLAYKEQLEWKRQVLSETLAHLGGIKDFVVSPVIPSKKHFGYRNKVQQPLAMLKGEVVSGFYERGSHNIVPVRKCMLEAELGSRVIEHAREAIKEHKLDIYNEKTGRGLLRYVIVRTSEAEGTAMLMFVATDRFKEEESIAKALMKRNSELKGVMLNINRRRGNVILGEESLCITGENHIQERIGGLKFNISAGSFFQANTSQAEEICKAVGTFAGLTGNETVVDFYSGVGIIGMSLAGKAKEVVMVEESPSAVADALRNQGLNKLGNLKFFEGKVEEVISNSIFPRKADIVVLDPPRQGAGQEVVNWIKKIKAGKVIYVSCDTGTFCRDLKYLQESGYKLTALVPVDMFPQTYHIELVAEFT